MAKCLCILLVESDDVIEVGGQRLRFDGPAVARLFNEIVREYAIYGIVPTFRQLRLKRVDLEGWARVSVPEIAQAAMNLLKSDVSLQESVREQLQSLADAVRSGEEREMARVASPDRVDVTTKFLEGARPRADDRGEKIGSEQ